MPFHEFPYRICSFFLSACGFFGYCPMECTFQISEKSLDILVFIVLLQYLIVCICTMFLLIRAPSLIVALPPEKPLTLYQTTIFLDKIKFKPFADDSSIVAKMAIFVFDRVENNVGKGENAGYQHFLLFPQCFQKASFPELLEVGIVW